MYVIPPRLTTVHQSFCTSQIWWTKISWISSRSENTGRCISCYHPTCWWLTLLLLTSLTVSTPPGGFCAQFNPVCVGLRLSSQEIRSSAWERNPPCVALSVITLQIYVMKSGKQKQHLSSFLSMFILQEKNKSWHLITWNSLYIERFANSQSKVYWIAA